MVAHLTARYTTINGAIHAVAAGGTVVVCPGTYRTEAVALKPVRLEGTDALIDAAGQKPVIPGPPGGSVVLHTHKVIVTCFVVVGFVVVGAGFDGVLMATSDNVQVSHNLLVHNGDVGVDLNGATTSTTTITASTSTARCGPRSAGTTTAGCARRSSSPELEAAPGLALPVGHRGLFVRPGAARFRAR